MIIYIPKFEAIIPTVSVPPFYLFPCDETKCGYDGERIGCGH